MSDQKLVCNVFLWCMAAIYLFAFTSLYLQIPGLYGNSGLLPARNMLKKGGSESSSEAFLRKPTLLWFAEDLGLTTATAMDLLCLVGICLGLMSLISRSWRNPVTFLCLWFLYFSLYQVGQTFLWFQWDILLLESGFLCLLVALARTSSSYSSVPHASIPLWLVKWLLFRLMFASGVVKLTSRCPTWWGLTALNWHYESQCIPTPLAWYAHQLPDWFQEFSVVMTYVIEGPISFLFFAPIRSLRIFSFYFQILFQILIILTGNYNFFNILTMTLCLSLLDDRHVAYLFPWLNSNEEIDSSSSNTYSRTQSFLNVCRKLIVALVMFVLIYWTQRLFAIKFNSVDIIHFKVEFSASQLNAALTNIVPISIWIGIITLVLEALLSFIRCCQQSGMFLKLWSTTQWFVMVCAAVWIFSISLVPYSSLDRNTQDNLWPVVKRWYAKSEYYEIVNSYGLFRRMTGVGGRPEVVIEGSNSINGPWKEYNFLYKPGPLEQSLPVVAPHQPRLDWQMWFAALGSYNHNPWFVHLAYKLLTGERDVLDLMDSNQPFKNPPRYVRAILYKYHYTRIKEDLGSISDVIRNARSIKSWWRREFSSEYLPPVSKEEPTLKQFLSHYELGESSGRAQISTGRLHNALNFLRSKVRRVDPFKLIAWLFTIGVVFNILVNQQSTIPERIKTHQD